MDGGGSCLRGKTAGRFGLRAFAAVVIAVLCAGCAGTTSTDDDYRLKVAHTASSLTAVVGSAQLAARQFLDGRLPQAYANYVISRAEQDGSSIQNTFDTRQPPDAAADDLRNRVDQPLQQITGDLTDLRVAVRTDDHAAMDSALADLAKGLKALSTFQEAS